MDPYATLSELRLDGHRLGVTPWRSQVLDDADTTIVHGASAGLALLRSRFSSLRVLHLARNGISTLVGSGLESLGGTLKELYLENNALDTLWLSPPVRGREWTERPVA